MGWKIAGTFVDLKYFFVFFDVLVSVSISVSGMLRFVTALLFYIGEAILNFMTSIIC